MSEHARRPLLGWRITQSIVRAALAAILLLTLVGTIAPVAAAQSEVQENASPAATAESGEPTPEPGGSATATLPPSPGITETPIATELPSATAVINEAEDVPTPAPSAQVTATPNGASGDELPALVTLSIETVDHVGAPVPGASYEIYEDVGNGQLGSFLGFASDGIDGTPIDGIATFESAENISVVARQSHVPKGYLPNSADVQVSLELGVDQSIQVVSPLGGSVVMHAQDENGVLSTFGCAIAFVDNAGTRGELAQFLCDYQDGGDGITTLIGLLPGSYLLAWGASSPDYTGGADIPFVIDVGEVFETTVQLIPTGTLIIHKQKPDGTPLSAACFVTFAVGGTPNPNAQTCDSEGSDGTFQLKLPPGDRIVRETVAPFGYARAADVLVQIESKQTTEITIVDPLASVLTVKSTDLWGTPITPTCLTLLTDAGGGVPGSVVFTGCVAKATASVTFKPLQPGNYLIRLDSTKAGFYGPQYVPVSVGLEEIKSFALLLNGPAPVLFVSPAAQKVLQTSVEIYWETDQPTEGSLIYGLTRESELPAPPVDPLAKAHRVSLAGLLADRTYYVRVRGSNPNGQFASATFTFHTAPAVSTARLVVTKTNGDGSVKLGNSCFQLFRDLGEGKPGASVWSGCDRQDSVPNDGRLVSGALAPGHYVLMEMVSPPGYTLAKPVLIELLAGLIKRVTVKDTHGGAVLTVLTKAHQADLDLPMLPGACYMVFRNLRGQPGDLLSQSCDSADGLDGKTRLGSLRAGSYLVYLSRVPKGYHFGNMTFVQIDIVAGQRTATFDRFLDRLDDDSNIVVRTVDANGRLLRGACYARVESTSVTETARGAHCDGDDGSIDGIVYLMHAWSGRGTLVEVLPPPGYQTGIRLSFNKVEGVLLTLSVTQTLGGVTLSITTRIGSTTTSLPGTCYGLVVYNSTKVVAAGCDTNLDGVIELRGVAPGKYLLFPTYAPREYNPSSMIVTVGTTNLSVFPRAFPIDAS
jgi:hypothetical protein